MHYYRLVSLCYLFLFPFFAVSQDSLSIGQIESVKKRLIALDTTLTSTELFQYSQFIHGGIPVNPTKLDRLAKKMYNSNDKGRYEKALKIGSSLLALSPNNISGLKEKGFAFKHLNIEDSSKIYFNLMVTAIKATLLSGDGSYKSPYILNNSFELYSLFEARYRLAPSLSKAFVSSNNDVRVLCRVGHITAFGQLNHWREFLKKKQFTLMDLDIDSYDDVLENIQIDEFK